ncbi:MAG: glycosyltransferase family 4 protein [Anaerolineales bacterium]
MRILFVADGRSPIAVQWIEHFSKTDHEVHLVTTFDCQPTLKLASLHFVPVAFSSSAAHPRGERNGLAAALPTGLRTRLRNWLGPFTLSRAAEQLRAIISKVQPDLVHAMRIPYEGMLAAASDPHTPLLISSWGNDFTLHARSNPFMGSATRKAMHRADALHSDTQRDVALAAKWGLAAGKPTIVLPGNGGVRRNAFYPAKQEPAKLRVINPRGIRSYVRSDVFFQSIPKVLIQMPEVEFECPGMAGEPEAQRWLEKLNIERSVTLTPKLNQNELADKYRTAKVMVSPSTHDGTPNSLLEAMACGVFPVLGDLDSIREWITDGENGFLVNPSDPDALASAILRALTDGKLRKSAADMNTRLISERADFDKNMQLAEEFYRQLIAS